MVIHLQTTGELDGCRNQAFALINQMTTSQTRLTTSPIAALVNRVVPLTFTVIQRILFFESLHVNLAVPDRYDGPWIPARCHHEIHQKPAHTAVPVHIRMNVYEYEVTEHDPHGRFLFLAQKTEEIWHCIPDSLAAGRPIGP